MQGLTHLLTKMAIRGLSSYLPFGLLPKLSLGLTPPRFYLHSITTLLACSPQNVSVEHSAIRLSEPIHQAVGFWTGFHLTWSKAMPLARTAQTVRAILLATAATTTLK